MSSFTEASVHVYNFDSGIKKIIKEKIPGVLYFGSKDSSFFKYGISKTLEKWVLDDKFVIMNESFKNNCKYPLTGKIEPVKDLADLLNGLPGSLVFFSSEGKFFPGHVFTRISHDSDPKLIEDLVLYHIENRSKKGVNLRDYSFLTKKEHQLSWQSFFSRIQNPIPFVNIPTNQLRYKCEKDGKEFDIKNSEKVLYVLSEKVNLATKAIVLETKRKYKDMIEVVMVLRNPKDGIEGFEALQYKGPILTEYPLILYNFNKMTFVARGYMPQDLLMNLFMGIEGDAVESIDVDLPIGEYERADLVE